MDRLKDVEQELERERAILNNMIEEARNTHEPINGTILKQSHKVDILINSVHKAKNGLIML
jgi:hypothetical protein